MLFVPKKFIDTVSNTIIRYSSNEIGIEKSLGIGDPSDSEESDDDDIQGSSVAKAIDLYDPKDFENLEASMEVKELFQNIMRQARARDMKKKL